MECPLNGPLTGPGALGSLTIIEFVAVVHKRTTPTVAAVLTSEGKGTGEQVIPGPRSLRRLPIGCREGCEDGTTIPCQCTRPPLTRTGPIKVPLVT